MCVCARTRDQAKQDIFDLEGKIAKGEFSELKQWLNDNIHESGSTYPSADDLLEAVTGR